MKLRRQGVCSTKTVDSTITVSTIAAVACIIWTFQLPSVSSKAANIYWVWPLSRTWTSTPGKSSASDSSCGIVAEGGSSWEVTSMKLLCRRCSAFCLVLRAFGPRLLFYRAMVLLTDPRLFQGRPRGKPTEASAMSFRRTCYRPTCFPKSKIKTVL